MALRKIIVNTPCSKLHWQLCRNFTVVLIAFMIGVSVGYNIILHEIKSQYFKASAFNIDGYNNALFAIDSLSELKQNVLITQMSTAIATSNTTTRKTATFNTTANNTSAEISALKEEILLLQRKLENPLYITTAQIGRLGNQMFEFASAYGLARSYGKRVHLRNSSVLPKIFPAMRNSERVYISRYDNASELVNLRYISDPKHSGYSPLVINLAQSANNISMSGYFQSWRYFYPYRDEIRELFRFDNPIEVEADKQITAVKAKALAAFNASGKGFNATAKPSSKPNKFGKIPAQPVFTLTWIAVHIRRGDIINATRFIKYGYLPASTEYLQRTADYYIGKYQGPNNGVVLMVFSDDLWWAKANFRPTKVGPSNSSSTSNASIPLVHIEYISNKKREIDMSLMSRCNATIMTVGSFGWWAAFLAGGETFYYAFPYQPGSGLARQFKMDDYYLPEWHLFF